MGYKSRIARIARYVGPVRTLPREIDEALRGWPAALEGLARRALGAAPSWKTSEAIRATGAVWHPEAPFLFVRGGIRSSGNVVVEAPQYEGGALLVAGDITCRNLVVGQNFSLFCTGQVSARECIIASASDSVCAVAGRVQAALLDSGSGAWMLIHRPDQLDVRHLTHHVMVGARRLSASSRPNLVELLVDPAIDWEEWEAMTDEERAKHDPAEFLRVSTDDATAILARGGSILR